MIMQRSGTFIYTAVFFIHDIALAEAHDSDLVDFGRCPDVLFVHSLFAQTSFERARWTSLIQQLDIHIDPRLLSLRCPICNFCLSCSCSEQILLRALQSLLSLAPKFAFKILPTLLSEKAQFCTSAFVQFFLGYCLCTCASLVVFKHPTGI